MAVFLSVVAGLTDADGDAMDKRGRGTFCASVIPGILSARAVVSPPEVNSVCLPHPSDSRSGSHPFRLCQ